MNINRISIFLMIGSLLIIIASCTVGELESYPNLGNGYYLMGQAAGDIAKQVSERLGKILQEKESISINNSGTSISKSKQLEYAVPVSTIATLSSGEFVGIMADTPEQPIELKTFHCKVQNDHDVLTQERESFVELPAVREVDAAEINKTYQQIKSDIHKIVDDVFEGIMSDPEMEYLILKKK